MLDLELERLLRTSPVTSPFFLGVFAPRELPRKPPAQTRFCFVLGTTNSYREAGHWVAVYANGDTAHVFCSFGTHPYRLPGLKRFLSSFREIYYNRQSHQSWDSEVCGGYVCYVLYQLCLGKSFVKILGHFDRIKRDDLYVQRFMYRQFGFRFE